MWRTALAYLGLGSKDAYSEPPSRLERVLGVGGFLIAFALIWGLIEFVTSDSGFFDAMKTGILPAILVFAAVMIGTSWLKATRGGPPLR